MLIMQSKRSNYKKWHYLCIFIIKMTKTIRKRRLAKQEYKQKKNNYDRKRNVRNFTTCLG